MEVLSVALFPIGLLAGMQTGDIVARAKDRADAALVGLTRDAAQAEREIIQRGFGMAKGLAPLAREVRDRPELCSDKLAGFVASQSIAVTVGFIQPGGDMWCASNGIRFSFADYPRWQEVVANPEATVAINPEAPVSGRPVVIISQPFWQDEVFAGYSFVSVPHERLAVQLAGTSSVEYRIVTFTAEGEFLTATGKDAEDPTGILPGTQALDNLNDQGSWTFRETSASGEERTCALSPIIDGTVCALGTWQPLTLGGSAPITISPQFFPLIMWVTSLGVSFATIHRLVIRHIGRLRRQMRAFARDRTLPAEPSGAEISAEIAEIQASFAAMA